MKSKIGRVFRSFVQSINTIDYRYRRGVYSFMLKASVLLIGFIMFSPIYWMIQNSLKTKQSILEGVSFFPTAESFTLSRYEIIYRGDIAVYMMNSVIVTAGTILVVVIVSTIAGYSLARLEYRGKVTFARILLLGYMFSPIVLGLPMYLIWKSIGLLDTRIGLIFALSALSMPFSVWITWKYIQTIPNSIEESAWIAGASRWRGIYDVILPQMKPAIIAVALFSFAVAWNDFTFAQILLPSNAKATFPPGMLRLLTGSYDTGWGAFMAASTLMTLPPLLFAYFLQSYLLKGFDIRSV